MLAGGLARFGFVTELLSVPVRLGYLMGIAVTVIAAQLPKLFGFSIESESLINGFADFVSHLDATDATALALGVGTLAAIVGDVPAGLPATAFPDPSLSALKTLLPAAIGIAFVAFADTSVLSRSYASRLHQDVDQNRELAVLGVANIATGLVQGFPISSSASRTAVADDMGARSQLAGLTGALALAVLLVAGTGLVHDLPLSALAAVVI